MSRLPDFIIIGAMKCATSTLHEQLARQPGIFMSNPKEPCFFSNDEIYGKGQAWYSSLFENASAGDICGESSTHYTKLPTYPHTIERMKSLLPEVRLIYVMRHPIDRLVSQYVHEWTDRTVSGSLDVAVQRYPRLIDYSRYSTQLRPYLEQYGRQNVLPLFFERLVKEPQLELERVCRFIGYAHTAVWHSDLEQQNVSGQRLRKSAIRDTLVWNPVSTWVRKKLVPQRWRDSVKSWWQMKQRPQLSAETRRLLEALFDEDLAMLGEWLGVQLDCRSLKTTVSTGPLELVLGCAKGDQA